MKERTYKYNEEAPAAPKHKFPRGAQLNLRKSPGAGARIVIEQLSHSLAGVHNGNLKHFGFSKRDIVKYRDQVRNALLSVVREGPSGNEPRTRGTAVAYLGELRIESAVSMLTGMGTSPAETTTVRGLAADALCRIGGDVALRGLTMMLDDPDAIVRKRAVEAISVIGGRKEGPRLATVAISDSDLEVRYQAARAARVLMPKAEHNLLPPLPKRPRSRRKKSMVGEPSIARSVGRNEGEMVQTDHTHDHHEDAERGLSGGIDHVATQALATLELSTDLRAVGYIVEGTQIRVVGLNGADSSRGLVSGHDVFHDPSGDRVINVRDRRLSPGRPLPFHFQGDSAHRSTPTFVADVAAAPVITSLAANVPVVWSGRKFGLRVGFRALDDQAPVWLKLEVKFPKSKWMTRWVAVSASDRKAGASTLSGFVCAESGRVEVRATLYGDKGGASRADTRFMSLPPNPHSVSIVPQTRGSNGEGPAHYNSGEDKYYCYATCTFTNGNSSAITVGPTVTCTVTDGGTPVATFSFSIGTWTVGAQSSRTLGIYTSHGSASAVYRVFDDFGDVRMDFSFQSSNGSVSDWHVWAAMAKIRLALNFVGNISSSTRATVQSVVETEASAIYEQQSLYISETARYLLPSDDSDWNRYRDIRMNDNKNSDCLAGSDEADDLRDDWSSPQTQWLDLWFVESFSGPACAASVGGFSPKNGPTGKGGSNSGAVIQMAPFPLTDQANRDLLGIVVAHEVGHFLGLDSGPGNHNSDTNNFMAASTGGSNTDITHGQYLTMTKHGFVSRFVP